MPTVKPKTTKTNRTLSYYDDVSYTLSDLRRVNLFGEVNAAMFSHVENSLAYQTALNREKPIHIILNSPGGIVIDGFAIYDVITHYAKRTPIHITAKGACMSMAVIILQAATLRLASPNTQFLLHEVNYGNRGSLSSHKDELEQTAKLQKKLDDVIVGRSGITQAELSKLIERRDYTINAQEALKHKLIDAIISR